MRVLVLLLLTACRSGPTPQPGAAPPDDAQARSAYLAQARSAYEAKQWGRCAELFAAVGTGPALVDAACCAALGGNAERAFATLDRALTVGYHNTERLRTDDDLAALRADPRWQPMLATADARVVAWEATLRDPHLRRELLDLETEDQAARNAWTDFKDPAQNARVEACDRKTTAVMKQAIAKYGWPGKAIVGEDGAHAAWLLVQHADADPAFQNQALVLLEAAFHAGEADESDYAYLYDRVAVHDKRPQRYGTQYIELDPAPIEDSEHVDERRRAIGLPSMAENTARIRAMYGPQSH